MATHHDGIFEDPNSDEKRTPGHHQTVRSDSSSGEISTNGGFVDRTISVRDWTAATFEDIPGQLKSYVVSLFPIATWIYRYNFTWFIGDVSSAFFFHPRICDMRSICHCGLPLHLRLSTIFSRYGAPDANVDMRGYNVGISFIEEMEHQLLGVVADGMMMCRLSQVLQLEVRINGPPN